MKYEKLQELYHYLSSKDNYSTGCNYSRVIECNFIFDCGLKIVFNIIENSYGDTFDVTCEVINANVLCVKNFTTSFDETKEEIDKILNKATTLVETFKSMIRDIL